MEDDINMGNNNPQDGVEKFVETNLDEQDGIEEIITEEVVEEVEKESPCGLRRSPRGWYYCNLGRWLWNSI